MENKLDIPNLVNRWADCGRFMESAKASGLDVFTRNGNVIDLQRSGRSASVAFVNRYGTARHIEELRVYSFTEKPSDHPFSVSAETVLKLLDDK